MLGSVHAPFAISKVCKCKQQQHCVWHIRNDMGREQIIHKTTTAKKRMHALFYHLAEKKKKIASGNLSEMCRYFILKHFSFFFFSSFSNSYTVSRNSSSNEDQSKHSGSGTSVFVTICYSFREYYPTKRIVARIFFFHRDSHKDKKICFVYLIEQGNEDPILDVEPILLIYYRFFSFSDKSHRQYFFPISCSIILIK